MIKVLQYIIEQHKEYDTIMLLQPTSPLRTAEDINKAISLYDGRSLYSGYYMPLKTKDKPYSGEQHFQRNGAIFITPVELIKQGKLWDDSVIEFEMPESRSTEIDNMDQWFMAESILEKLGREGK
jgi:CMP-N-acetylneuraminic acid synthetase